MIGRPASNDVRRFLATALFLLVGTLAFAQAGGVSEPQATRHLGRLVVRLRQAPVALALGATGLGEFDRACRRVGATSLRPLIAPRRVARAASEAFVEAGLDRIVRVEVAVAERDAARAELLRCAEVERVDLADGARGAKVPNDPSWGSQWPLQSNRLDMPKAWNVLTDATGVPIAVIDSGCDQQHNDFKSNRWINAGEIAGNAIDDDGNGYVDDRFGYDFVNLDGDPDDDFGHGTEVAGVLAAVGDNVLNICGVCWKAEVISCKSLDSTGFGTFDELAEGLVYAADNGARVANMSFVASVDDSTLRAAVDYARALEVVQVGAAGNNGNKVVMYPAAYDGVLAVIATDSGDTRWTTSTHGSWCDVAAPGASILTLRNNGGTTTDSGTSFAAPHVAGLAALVRKLNPDLDRLGVELVLCYSAEDRGAAGFDDDFAWGRVNGQRALDLAQSLRASVTEIPDGGKFSLTLDAPTDPGFVYFVIGGFSDRFPGVALSTYDPADERFFPVNHDWLFDFTLGTPVNPVFIGFQGVLDATGAATATVDLPRHAFKGMALDFAYVTLDPANLNVIQSVSAPARVWIR